MHFSMSPTSLKMRKSTTRSCRPPRMRSLPACRRVYTDNRAPRRPLPALPYRPPPLPLKPRKPKPKRRPKPKQRHRRSPQAEPATFSKVKGGRGRQRCRRKVPQLGKQANSRRWNRGRVVGGIAIGIEGTAGIAATAVVIAIVDGIAVVTGEGKHRRYLHSKLELTN